MPLVLFLSTKVNIIIIIITHTGFRIDPVEKLEEIFKELKTLHEVFSKNPIFGVEFAFENEGNYVCIYELMNVFVKMLYMNM
jgi:hypothetical protein